VCVCVCVLEPDVSRVEIQPTTTFQFREEFKKW